jgi:uncharacterized protein DUF1629
MKFFSLESMEGAERLSPINEEDYDLLKFDGSPLGTLWRPMKVRRQLAGENGMRTPSDFPSFGLRSFFGISRRAADALGQLLNGNAEILPLAVEDGSDFSILNVTKVVDALDEPKSVLMRIPTGRIVYVKKPAFRLDAIRGLRIFRLPLTATAIYMSREFTEAVEAAGLKGMRFEDAWSDESLQ